MADAIELPCDAVLAVRLVCGFYLVELDVLSYAYGAPRDLHSFPTRRSSDLQRSTRLRDVDDGAFDFRSTQIDAPEIHGGTKIDRKSTRLNSSHPSISYAVFCLKKKNPPTVPLDSM